MLALCWAARTAPAQIVKPLAVHQARYEMRSGEPAALSAPAETLDFLLKAKTRTVDVPGAPAGAVVLAPNRSGDRLMVSAPARTPPGEYTARVSATSETGEVRAAALTVVVKPRQTVPVGSSRPPVVLLNGWETGFTGTCPLTSASDTFGNLPQYLTDDGVPVVYFFDNCAEDANASIETLGADLATAINGIKYSDGTQVPQIDLIGFSMGGLIARAYLAGMQNGGTFDPPATTLVRDLILIATPNFGSFVAGNYIQTITAGSQSAELIPGSTFLWNLDTWNQRGDDLRGVNAVAIAGNAGAYVSGLSSTTGLNNASDGLVSLTSAALGFALPGDTPTRVVPYCHIDPSAFTNTGLLGTFACTAAGIANITSTSHPTSQIVRSFLSGTTDWQSVGTDSTKDTYLSVDGGIFFAMQDTNGSYVSDLSAVSWGSVPLVTGGETSTVYYTDFVSGKGQYTAVSSSLGTINCGTLTEDAGYFSAARCKIGAAIFSIGPLADVPGRIVNSGATITITGNTFGSQCNDCQVLATPIGSSTATALTVSSWSNTSISAALPSSITGLTTITVKAVPGTDSITVMAAQAGPTLAATPASLQFAYTVGGTAPAAQPIQITNAGSGTVTWTAASSDSWLTLSETSGTAPSTLSIGISPGTLAAGTYNGTVTLTATGAAASPATIAVKLTVTGGSASLSVSPQSLNFSFSVGAAAPAAQSISITGGGSGTLSWTAAASVPWAGVSPSSGTGSGAVSVTVNPFNMAAGSYTGNIQIAAPGAGGSPASVTLTLVVTGTQAAGAITNVTNAGSFQAGIASATWVSIFGTNLSATIQSWRGSDIVNGVLPASLQGVSVTFNGQPAYVEYISPTQINVLAPDDSTTGQVQVQVTTAGQASNTVTAQKQQYAPAWFTFAGGAYVAAQHTDYSDVGKAGLFPGVTTTPAKPGEIVLLYGTGFGPTDPPAPTNQLVTAPVDLPSGAVQITIGGAPATIQFAGLTGSGLYQFNVTVPDVPDGDAAVVATIGGVSTQNGVSLTIQH